MELMIHGGMSMCFDCIVVIILYIVVLTLSLPNLPFSYEWIRRFHAVGANLAWSGGIVWSEGIPGHGGKTAWSSSLYLKIPDATNVVSGMYCFMLAML